MGKVLKPVKSPFRFRLDRRDASALVEAWIVISKDGGDSKFVRVEGPITLNSYKRKIEHSYEILLDPGEYRCKVEITVTEADTLAGLYNFRLSVRDTGQDQTIYDERSNQSIDTTDEIDVIVGADAFKLVVA